MVESKFEHFLWRPNLKPPWSPRNVESNRTFCRIQRIWLFSPFFFNLIIYSFCFNFPIKCDEIKMRISRVFLFPDGQTQRSFSVPKGRTSKAFATSFGYHHFLAPGCLARLPAPSGAHPWALLALRHCLPLRVLGRFLLGSNRQSHLDPRPVPNLSPTPPQTVTFNNYGNLQCYNIV